MQNIPPYLPIYSLKNRSQNGLSASAEQVVVHLSRCGLQVALVNTEIVKTDDSPKELYLADFQHSALGHHLFLQGSRESLLFQLRVLARKVDLVLVETNDELDLPELLLEKRNGVIGPELLDLSLYHQNPEMAAQRLVEHLQLKMALRPVWACILIGGKSSRMGRPKHLLTDDHGATWLEQTVHLLQPLVAGIVLSGDGEIPMDLQSLTRLPDIPGVSGPLTGILSAMRWQPDVSWLLLACDMPAVSHGALTWLLNEQQPGQWGSVPRVAGKKGVEPLLARYEPQCKAAFEMMCDNGIRRISSIVDFSKVRVVEVPEHLCDAWLNINTPLELEKSRL